MSMTGAWKISKRQKFNFLVFRVERCGVCGSSTTCETSVEHTRENPSKTTPTGMQVLSMLEIIDSISA